jgi:hypothetical protein
MGLAFSKLVSEEADEIERETGGRERDVALS